MAEMGYNLLIISRNEEKLNKNKEEFKLKYKKCSKIRTLAVDFTKPDIYDRIESAINELKDIHVLINNAGISYNYPEYFASIPESIKLIEAIALNCNVMLTTRMTQMDK